MDCALETHIQTPTRETIPQIQGSARPREADNRIRYALVFIVSLAILTAGIATDHAFRLDEIFYIRAAHAFIAGAPTTNRDHPPFAKYLIALSIKIFGDTPMGYKFPSGVAGALVALSGFGVALRLTRSLHSAYIAWFFLLMNGFLFVESRSANLIIFQLAFEVAGVWAFQFALENNAPRWFACSGVLLGLSVASRWCGVVALVVCGVYSLVYFRRLTKELWWMTASALATYVATWVPLLVREHRSLAYLLTANRYILLSHLHYSQNMIDLRPPDPWWAWMIRFEQQEVPMELIANPVIASLGLVAILVLLWQRKPLLPALYAVHIFQWALAHDHPQYYYYYLDAFTWLTIALAVALQGASFKRVRLDVVVAACSAGSALWPIWTAFRH